MFFITSIPDHKFSYHSNDTPLKLKAIKGSLAFFSPFFIPSILVFVKGRQKGNSILKSKLR